MADTGTKYSNDMIANTFKPYEDAIAAQSAAAAKELGYEAEDKVIASRYDTSTPEDRFQLLQVKFDNLTKDAYWASKLSSIDTAMLKRAATLPTYAEAIQYLLTAWKIVAWSSAWSSSAIASAVQSWKVWSGWISTPTKWWDVNSTDSSLAYSAWLGNSVLSWEVMAWNDEVKQKPSAPQTQWSNLQLDKVVNNLLEKLPTNPLNRPKAAIDAIKKTPGLALSVIKSFKQWTAAAKAVSKVLWVVAEWAKAINPEYIAVDLVESWLMDKLTTTKNQRAATAAIQSTIAKIDEKIKEYTDKWLSIPKQLTDAKTRLLQSK